MVDGGSDNTPPKAKPEHSEAPEERIKNAGPIEAANIMLQHVLGGGINRNTEKIAKQGAGDVRASSDLSGNITEYSKSGEITAIHDKHGNNVLGTEKDLPRSANEKKTEKSAFTISQDGNTITTPDHQTWHKGHTADGKEQWQNGKDQDFLMIWNGHITIKDGKPVSSDPDCPITKGIAHIFKKK